MKDFFHKNNPGLKVLLISPDNFAIKIYKNLFTKFGHFPVCASDIEKGIEIFNESCSRKKPIDLVFIHYEKYKINQIEFETALRAKHEKVIVGNMPTSFIYDIKKLLDNVSEK